MLGEFIPESLWSGDTDKSHVLYFWFLLEDFWKNCMDVRKNDITCTKNLLFWSEFTIIYMVRVPQAQKTPNQLDLWKS